MRDWLYAGIVAALVLSAAGQSRAQIYETGSLRSFILGDEPAAAYDNWVSHTVEGLAVEGGYNHHIPPELDPQTTGFGQFEFIAEEDAPEQRLLWRQVFTHLWNDEPAQIESLFLENQIPYQVVYFSDTETGRTYRMLRETLNPAYVDTGFYAGPDDDVTGSFDKGWGLFIYSPDAEIPWAQIQSAHVNDDFISVPIVTDLFLDGNLGALTFHGAGREVMWVDGQDYNNSRSLSDPTRNGDLPFQWFTEFVIDTLRAQGERDLTIQYHSYDSESHNGEPTIQVSCGSEDGFANRLSRDYSGSGYDWVNFAPEFVVPAGYSMPNQPAVSIEDYFSIWRAGGLQHLASGISIPTNVPLTGHPGSPQMAVASDGYHRFEVFDRWLHVEFDELPFAVQNSGYTELDFFAGTSPPTEVNWEPLLAYYESSSNAMVDYLLHVEHAGDVEPPTTPAGLSVFYAADSFVELTWSERSLDPNFATYEIYYGTGAEIDTTDAAWTSEDAGNLVGQNVNFARVSGLDTGLDYGFRVRGVDLFGNASELSDSVRVVTEEGDQPPLSFSLLTPQNGDTCFTLDTTLTWQSTLDPDPFDTPHYDVWLDTLADFSTAWLIADADSIPDTTFDLTDLPNRRTFYWTVRATDRNTAGTWANEINSFVTWRPLPPAPFDLLSPVDRSTVWDTTTVRLEWQATYSQDNPESEIGYVVIWDTSEDFTADPDTAASDTTFLVIDNLQMNETYWWEIYAYDETPDTVVCNDGFRFYTWDQPPPSFALLDPADGQQVGDDTVAVQWSVPEDPVRRRGGGMGRPSAMPVSQPTQLSQRLATAPKGSNLGGGEGWASIRNQGGPDGFGHLWIDNDQPGGPTYDWFEISEVGTLSTVSDIDDGTEVIELPFDFPYFGNAHSSVVVSSNGNIHFGTPDASWQHYTIPSPNGPAGIIAPWWLDLRPNVQGDIYTYGTEDQFIVQWTRCREYSNADWLYTFQVVLEPSGRIRFHYKEMIGGLANATVGIENLAEDDGLLIAFNADWVEDRISVFFTFEDWLYNVQWSAQPDFSLVSETSTFDNETELTDIVLAALLRDAAIDELPDDLTVYWRVNTLSLYNRQLWADPGESGRRFTVYIQEPPSTFELLTPPDGGVVSEDTVTVTWSAAFDPDPQDTLSYLVEWSASDTLGEPRFSATVTDTYFTITGLEQVLSQRSWTSTPRGLSKKARRSDTDHVALAPVRPANAARSPQQRDRSLATNEVDELPDDSVVYWRVSASDQVGNVSWPVHGSTPWSFFVQVPQPPEAFSLLAPADGDTLSPVEVEELTLTWQPSIDPDPADTVAYSITMNVVVGTELDTTMTWHDYPDTSITGNLPEILGVADWTEWWEVSWEITAVSGSDTVACDQPFHFQVAPALGVRDTRFAGVPTEWSIAAIYPNPFNASATVVLGLPTPASAQIHVYNVLGRRVQSLQIPSAAAGYHALTLDGSRLASGLYFVHAVVPEHLSEVRKVMLVR